MNSEVSHIRCTNVRREKYYRAVIKDGRSQRVLLRHLASATAARTYGNFVYARFQQLQALRQQEAVS